MLLNGAGGEEHSACCTAVKIAHPAGVPVRARCIVCCDSGNGCSRIRVLKTIRGPGAHIRRERGAATAVCDHAEAGPRVVVALRAERVADERGLRASLWAKGVQPPFLLQLPWLAGCSLNVTLTAARGVTHE